jgi:N-sulfoglucosamine sulfohydrolase
MTTDDMHWDSVGVYHSPVKGITPNLDRLANEGFMFRHAYVQIAICTPSRQVMLSGNHSHQTMTRCFTPVERVGPTLPDLLKQNNYFLANINKRQNHYPWDIQIDEEESACGRDVSFYGPALTRIIEKAQALDKPFFIMANMNDPHRPFHGAGLPKKIKDENRVSVPSHVYTAEEVTVPGFLPDLSEVRREMAEYYSSVRRADDCVGVMLETIKDLGVQDNTVILFMSDHGISMPFSKINCYRASLRVPLLFRWPGRIKPQSIEEQQMVSAIDLVPTLLEMVGIEIPRHIAGRSFFPIMQGQQQKDRDFIIGYYYRNLRQTNMFPTFTIQTRDQAYIYNPWSDGNKEVHNSDYTHSRTLAAMWDKAQTDHAVKRRVDFHKFRVIEEFYDYSQDPYAFENLIHDIRYQSDIKKMKKKLQAWMAETDHPATELMKDPHNQEKIDQYMQYEFKNAQKQIEELKQGR